MHGSVEGLRGFEKLVAAIARDVTDLVLDGSQFLGASWV